MLKELRRVQGSEQCDKLSFNKRVEKLDDFSDRLAEPPR